MSSTILLLRFPKLRTKSAGRMNNKCTSSQAQLQFKASVQLCSPASIPRLLDGRTLRYFISIPVLRSSVRRHPSPACPPFLAQGCEPRRDIDLSTCDSVRHRPANRLRRIIAWTLLGSWSDLIYLMTQNLAFPGVIAQTTTASHFAGFVQKVKELAFSILPLSSTSFSRTRLLQTIESLTRHLSNDRACY